MFLSNVVQLGNWLAKSPKRFFLSQQIQPRRKPTREHQEESKIFGLARSAKIGANHKANNSKKKAIRLLCAVNKASKLSERSSQPALQFCFQTT